MQEITDLHTLLLANLRLGVSVFLNDDPRDAIRLLEEKTRFRDLEMQYASNHLNRLTDNTPESIETSSLHLDLISELKRINSLISAMAYPILESAGALAPNRLRRPVEPGDTPPLGGSDHSPAPEEPSPFPRSPL